ncbi:MAG: hypothetical protein U0354_01245 [Candidatus Sericytochromatia bacterium]
MDFIIRYLSHALYLVLMASISYSYWYNYQLLIHLGFGVAILIGFYVAFSIFSISKLSESKNPKIKAVGEFYGMIYMYTALFQGTVLTNLTFYIIGSINDLTIYELHMFDWIYGITYSGFIVYGLGCILGFTVAEDIIGKVLAFFIVVIHWASFIYIFFYEDQFKDLFLNSTNLIIGVSFFIQLFSSILMMKIMLADAINKNIEVKK